MYLVYFDESIGLPVRGIHERGIAGIAPLTHRGKEKFQDVLAWITAQQSAPK